MLEDTCERGTIGWRWVFVEKTARYLESRLAERLPTVSINEGQFGGEGCQQSGPQGRAESPTRSIASARTITVSSSESPVTAHESVSAAKAARAIRRASPSSSASRAARISSVLARGSPSCLRAKPSFIVRSHRSPGVSGGRAWSARARALPRNVEPPTWGPERPMPHRPPRLHSQPPCVCPRPTSNRPDDDLRSARCVRGIGLYPGVAWPLAHALRSDDPPEEYAPRRPARSHVRTRIAPPHRLAPDQPPRVLRPHSSPGPPTFRRRRPLTASPIRDLPPPRRRNLAGFRRNTLTADLDQLRHCRWNAECDEIWNKSLRNQGPQITRCPMLNLGEHSPYEQRVTSGV